jgi:hypothetical protein
LNQFSRKRSKAIDVSLRISVIQHNVFSFAVSTFSKALLECFEVWLIAAADKKYSDACDFIGLLRLRHSPGRRECDDSGYDSNPF